MGDSSSRLSSNDLALRVCGGASGTILAALVCIVVLRITSVLGVNPGDAWPEGGALTIWTAPLEIEDLSLIHI